MSNNDEISELEASRVAALLTADIRALKDMFAESAVWVHSSGRVDDRSGLLELVGSGKIKFLSITVADQNVRIYGDCAIVEGTVVLELEVAGSVHTPRNQHVIVWTHVTGAWKIVHWQSTSLSQSHS